VDGAVAAQAAVAVATTSIGSAQSTRECSRSSCGRRYGAVGGFVPRDVVLRPRVQGDSPAITFTEDDEQRADGVDVVSIACGALAEHNLKITVLSAIRNTAANVTFWWSEDYVSPADRFRFRYKFVSYKWQNWLRQQRSQQRAAAPIRTLFVDLIRPVDVRRVMLIEPGCVVRGDLREGFILRFRAVL
jgi:hypothetical protein